MQVKLVAATKPINQELIDMGIDDLNEFIAYCARVSNPANQFNTETSEKLLNYLKKHQHWSPFEMASATMEIITTRDIARQILRHRSFSFQEFSQRYADPRSLGEMFVKREARLQDLKNRQNSIKIEDEDNRIQSGWDAMQDSVIQVASQAYNWALENGIAKEQARAVLPEGLTVSRLFMTGTIRSWIHYCDLRSSHGTQLEHQEIAVAISKAISTIFKV